jgi:hypothetical protein
LSVFRSARVRSTWGVWLLFGPSSFGDSNTWVKSTGHTSLHKKTRALVVKANKNQHFPDIRFINEVDEQILVSGLSVKGA